jgi:hypothetical protein
MRFKATGQVLHTAAGYSARVRIGAGANDRPTFALAVTSDAAAEERAALLAGLAGRLRRVAACDEILVILEEAGNARTKADLAEVQTAAEAILNGETAKVSSSFPRRGDTPGLAMQASLKPPNAGGVYFVQSAEPGNPIKIGVAKVIARRFAGLQTAHAWPLVLRAWTPGGPNEEEAFHSRFASSRMRGEWFRPSEDPKGIHVEGEA